MDKDEAKTLYESLSAEERRERIILRPAFRIAYNEITEAHRAFPVSQYLWKWLPVVGPTAICLYLELRRHTYHNPKTGETRIRVWPKQETLAKSLGVSRKTVMRTLPTLEDHGFIKRFAKHALGPDGRPHRKIDEYDVYWEVPLLPEDAAELLSRETVQGALPSNGGGVPVERVSSHSSYESQSGTDREEPYESQNGTHGEAVDNSPYEGQSGTHIAVPIWDSRTSTRTITKNVTNVHSPNGGRKRTLRDHPVVRELTVEERDRREALALEVGETLQRMAGREDGGSAAVHKSAGFHRRVCLLLPEPLIRQALMATRDAFERRQGSGGGFERGPGAYFAGAVKKLAEANGVELGLKASTIPSEMPQKRTTDGTTGPEVGNEGSGKGEAPMDREKTKQALAELLANLKVKSL